MFGFATKKDLKNLREELLAANKKQQQQIDTIMRTQAQAESDLRKVIAELAQVRKEQTDDRAALAAKVATCEAQIAALQKILEEGGTLSPGADAALTELRVSVRSFNKDIPGGEPTDDDVDPPAGGDGGGAPAGGETPVAG